MYTSPMQTKATKTGIHFHVRVGPEEVRLFDRPPLAGPYVDVIVDDVGVAHGMFVRLIQEHLPEYLDEEDIEESAHFAEQMEYDLIDEDEAVSVDMSVEQHGLEFEMAACKICIPKGMN